MEKKTELGVLVNMIMVKGFLCAGAFACALILQGCSESWGTITTFNAEGEEKVYEVCCGDGNRFKEEAAASSCGDQQMPPSFWANMGFDAAEKAVKGFGLAGSAMKDVLANCCAAAGTDDTKADICAKNAAKGCLVLNNECGITMPISKITSGSGSASATFDSSPTPSPTPPPR